MISRLINRYKNFFSGKFQKLNDTNFSLKLIHWLLPVFLFLTATFYEIIEHGWKHTEPFTISLSAEIVFFGISGPAAIALVIGYMRVLVKSETDARQKFEVLNRKLESEVGERTALLAERNQQLDDANRQLKRVDEMKSEFVSLVSHELRAPLTALNGGLEVALQSTDTLPPSSRRILEAMVKESDRLTRFVQTILDVSRMEAGNLTLNLGPVAVSPVLHRAVEVVLGSRRELTWNLPDQIPPVWADEVYFEQILRNLLRNADKYSPAETSIEINIEVCEDTVSVEVADHGMGIPLESQDKIFERFHRGETGESAPPGWGLGLYFAKKLTEAQNGKLRLRSPLTLDTEGPGSAFSISLPIVADEPEEGKNV